ncbi:MAG: hypothetical protein PUA90_04235 [bacterium]|nr:hypothetical protein [bacterium]
MYEVFNKELSYIKDKRIKNSLITILNKLPEYFYSIPASSTGKYHPEFAASDCGLVKHTKVAVRIAYELFNDEAICNFNQNEKDLIIFAITVHDGLKEGRIKEKYTAFNHPILMSEFIKENSDKLELTKDEIEFVCRCVETHMGPWIKDYNGNEVLPYPKDKYQRFVHMCDYLSSKKFLDVKFDNNNDILY